MGQCCLTIKPQYVVQWNRLSTSSGRAGRAWSPIKESFPFGGAGTLPPSENWDDAFEPPFLPSLVQYPEELKVECFALEPEGVASFLFRANFETSSNCGGDNPYNQSAFVRLRMEVCANGSVLTFTARGKVERKDLHFDFISVYIRKINSADPGFSDHQILYEHGTGEGLDCQMADKVCCVSEVLPEGEYWLDIHMATGDGLHHVGAYWELGMAVNCGPGPACDENCSTTNQPWTQPGAPNDHDPGDGDFVPPFGLPDPGANPPTPGYRGDCACNNCDLIGLGADISGLVASTCTYTAPGGETTVYHDKTNNLNGGYVLSKSGAQWLQNLGTFHSDADPGILVATSSYTEAGTGDEERETYALQVTGTLTCAECTLNGAPGLKWSGTLAFSFQSRRRAPEGDNIWYWDVTPLGQVCGNLVFDQLVEQLCEAPPGCGGRVVYNNGANTGLHQPPPGNCSCGDVLASVGTLTMEPIGTTVLCT